MKIRKAQPADGASSGAPGLLHTHVSIAVASLFLAAGVATAALSSPRDLMPFASTPPVLSCHGDTPGFCP